MSEKVDVGAIELCAQEAQKAAGAGTCDSVHVSMYLGHVFTLLARIAELEGALEEMTALNDLHVSAMFAKHRGLVAQGKRIKALKNQIVQRGG